jgi:ribosome recycling factor
MDPQTILTKYENNLKKAADRFSEEVKKLRTGRAHPSMLDGVTVEAYGTPMSLIQVATVSAPEAQLLQITPFDPNNLDTIAVAIRDDQSLGMNPSDDGRIVRVPIPPLTEERRQQIVKQLREKVEEILISMRGARRDALHELDQAKKDKAISEDEQKRLQKDIEDSMAKHKASLDSLAKAKESEIMTV